MVRKLAVLMALVQASRSSELAALDLKYRVVRPEGITFRLATLTEKRSPGAPPKELFFGSFPEDERVCVIRCLRVYERSLLNTGAKVKRRRANYSSRMLSHSDQLHRRESQSGSRSC